MALTAGQAEVEASGATRLPALSANELKYSPDGSLSVRAMNTLSFMNSIYLPLGTFGRLPLPSNRTSVVPSHVITEVDIDYRRPGTGISPDKLASVLSRELKNSIISGSKITWDDFY
jgi:hypothetical protein